MFLKSKDVLQIFSKETDKIMILQIQRIVQFPYRLYKNIFYLSNFKKSKYDLLFNSSLLLINYSYFQMYLSNIEFIVFINFDIVKLSFYLLLLKESVKLGHSKLN